ncbi:amino acid adenylation domain-containing protein [Paenibacillus dokdonensis]|uniref:Amino acid adenylation domain-containing protein n=1 Tax=Paenibacillus dokdonensis TaxID=2567944 RepID=A0ABU6GNZ3_9BACL|nr:non-ribosomal peptide synthetase [Paenibacillus dokdonensis]MEC0241464.1 amino acid adenylation domain-containing protein [Paenibacillus dokdonensis]
MSVLTTEKSNLGEWKSYIEQLEERTILRGHSGKAPFPLQKFVYTWSQEFQRMIQKGCESARIAPDTLLGAAWSMLLIKYLRREEVAFAMIDSSEEAYPLILTAKGETTLKLLLQQTASAVDEHKLKSVNLQEISDICGLEGSLPVCNTAIWTGNEFAREELQGKFDVSVSYHGRDGSGLEVLYANDIFSSNFIRRMCMHLQKIMTECLSVPGTMIREISLLSQEEEDLLSAWNLTEEPFDLDRTIHGMFEEQAEKTPNHTAVVYKEESLTFRELNDKADRLARVLARKGAGPERIVGIIATPSMEMIVGTLAILKTGAAYLPIDPAYPADRILYMLEDSGTKLLVTEPNVKLDGQIRFNGEAICAAQALASGNHNEAQEEGELFGNPHALEAPKPNDLAYIIYTSGSTGRPKGVMVEHRTLVNLCAWHIKEFKVTDKDRSTKYAGFGFDASVWEMFPYLVSGASIYVIPEEIRLDSGQLHAYFIQNDITISFLPTQFCEHFMTLDNPSLRILLTGGDKLKTFSKQNYELYNCYGPTENTVVTTAYRVMELEENIPIGYPIDNSQVHIVDAYGHPQPIGIAGELCIAGQGLARGYLNQPELTNEKFIVTALAGGGRMYRTGDLARWTEDGVIEFLGRIDHQVKIRGFRIEIGEIEHRLLLHPHVSEVIVIDLDDASGAKYLCAYVVADEPFSYDEMSAFLSENLPDYMVPAKLVQLTELPLTANGKVDRRALPAPAAASYDEQNYKAPAGVWEEGVASLWEEVLGLNRIDACESFFMAGGDSLKIVILQTKLQRRFGISVPVTVLFGHATVREQAEWIEQAAQNQQSEGQLAVTAELQAADTAKMVRRPVQEHYPVASAQRRLYFIEQMDQIGTAYNAPFAFRIEGSADPQRLEQAFRSMIERHDVFRMSFHWENDEIMQRIHKQVPFELNVMAAPEEGLHELLHSLILPFDLAKAPLLRAWLIQCGSGNSSVLLVDFHHIAVDGVSANIFFNELSRLYRGDTLEDLPIGFADFAVWQSETAGSSSSEEQRAYWEKTLSGDLPILQLPTDLERPAKQSFQGETVTLLLDASAAEQLKTFAVTTATTPFMVLFAGYHALLSRYTNQEDVITGVPLAGRMYEEVQSIIGMFVNTMPVRCYPEKRKPFAQLLQEVKAALLDTFEHQDYELEELVRSLNIPRDPSRNLLFDTLFVMQNTGKLELQLEGTVASHYPYIHPISKYDLMVDVTEEEDGIRIDLQYCTDLFERQTIEAFGSRFLRMLSDAMIHPGKMLCELEMLSAEEDDFVVNQLNATASAYADQMTIHGLFEEQVRLTPDKAALVFGDRTMDYRELNERANQLAYTLRSKGVKPDQVVGLMVDRSFEMIIGLLAILKAGGAYVPIDPEYPQDRIVYMLENSHTTLLLTQAHLAGNVVFAGETLLIDKEEAYSSFTDNLPHVNGPADLLYVIYTSGTTGKPKGVMIEHRNIVNLLHYEYSATNVDYSGNVLQFTTISFDVCSQEIWSTLAAGGTLHMIPSDLRMNVGDLLAHIERMDIQILFMPVSFLKFILNEKEYADRFPSSVKHVITAGEQLIVPEKFRAHLTRYGVYLHNHYGPSETHVVTTHTIDPSGVIPELPPIGKPIANTQIYIVNDDLQPQPVGVAGELYIAGHNVGRGYYNNEEMTKERYLRSPFIQGDRMYKTGDLARWTKEGTIEFLGRLDHQVKIRGFRIELGEVENCLLNQPAVSEAIVVAKEDGKGGHYLCAYFTAGAELGIGELREHIGKQLPDYMIPSYFMQLPEMPLTPNGKIDRKALPEPDASQARSKDYVAPRTDIEQAVADVWQAVLQVDKIGVQDNFFELGGHSLKATIVVARLQKQFEIGMNDIFEYQTVAALANKIKPKTNHLHTRLEQVKQLNAGLKNIDLSKEEASYVSRNQSYDSLDVTAMNGYQNVLLTGATGYLGAHLLYEAISSKDWSVHVIVRAGSDHEAGERLRQKYAYYFGPDWFERYEDRINVYAGDITKDHLGLADHRYEELLQHIDAVFHAAANVKHYGSYADFELQNVKATANLLDFAAEGKPKHMHHMSTLGVATGVVEGKRHVCFTEYDLDLGQQFENYYAKTKFEAERLVLAARDKGVITNIYRLGNIVFHSQTGRFQENIADNAFYTTLKSFLELGTVPGEDNDIDFTYVDQTSKAILLLAGCEACNNEVFHIANPHEANVGAVLQDNPLDISVELLSFDKFVDYLHEHYDDENFKHVIEQIMLHYGWMEETIFTTYFKVFSSKTTLLLSRLGFNWSTLNQEMIQQMFEHCKEEGFM